MLMIVSPTKQMKLEEHVGPLSYTAQKERSEAILNVLRELSVEELVKLMKIKEGIAKENQERYQNLRLDKEGYAAIQTYYGLQFKRMHMEDFQQEDWEYAQSHLRILSGLYGVVKPFDSIYPYRLEFQCKLRVEGHKDLYDYWGDSLANELKSDPHFQEDSLILNLASKEYAKAILPYIGDHVITITFYIIKNGKLKTESTQVKMARGAMIGYLIRTKATSLSDVKAFNEEGYQVDEDLSSPNELVFVKQPE